MIADILSWAWTITFLSTLYIWIGGRPKARMFLPVQPARWIVEASAEVHPFIPYLILGNLAVVTWDAPPVVQELQYVISVGTLVGWFLDKDDDRWKRRRKKLGGKVRSLGHRLVVAPAGAR